MPVKLEDIKHFADEVKSLVDAGLPLESHLAQAGEGQGRRLHELTASITQRLSAGESLEEIVRSRPQGAPPMLAAAIAAGLQSGNLAKSVEMLGDMSDDLVGIRRRILSSLSYPLTIAAVAFFLFAVFIRVFLSRVIGLLDEPDINASPVLRWILELEQDYWWWPVLGLIVAAVFGLFWVISGRAQSMAFRGPERILFVLPGVKAVIRELQFYSLVRTLGLMVEGQMPVTDALVLAGPCSGNSKLERACLEMAEQIKLGNLPSTNSGAKWRSGDLPPMLKVCLQQTSLHEQQFNDRLSNVAGYYRRRLEARLLWLTHVVPVAMFIGIAGGTVTLYSLSVFWPVTQLLRLIALN